MGSSTSKLPPLQCAPHCNIDKFMGSWFVIAVKPTPFETKNSNAVETYSRADPNKSHDIEIDFKHHFHPDPYNSSISSMPQKAYIVGDNKDDSAEWRVCPNVPLVPLRLPYLLIEIDEKDYQYSVVGYPSRDYCWIMYRHPQMPEETYNMLTKRLEEKHHYNLDKLRKVPQIWTKEMREKRNFTEKEIPDSMLTSITAGPTTE